MKKLFALIVCTVMSIFILPQNLSSYADVGVDMKYGLLRDTDFATSISTTINGNSFENLQNGNVISDCWFYDQYNSNYILRASDYYVDGNTKVFYSGQEKKLFVNSSDSFVYLYTDTSYDYGGARRHNQAIVTNQLRQSIINSLPVCKTNDLSFKTEFCIAEYENKNQTFDPTIHTAQIQIVFTVRNLNKNSTGYNDYFTFVLPLYDARYEMAPEYNNGANGGDSGKKFIYNIAASSFLSDEIDYGRFYSINVNLSRTLYNVFNLAKSNQYLIDCSWSDMYVDDFRIMETVPGIYKIGCYFKNLSLDYGITSTNAYSDDHYESGFAVYTTEEGNGTIVGELKKDNNTNTPKWTIAQWNSKNNIATGYKDISKSLWLWGDSSKQVFVRPETNTLGLLMNASSEYTSDRQPNQPWPCIILNQEFDFDHDIKLSETSALMLDASYRVTKSENRQQGPINPSLHAAQLLWYITVQNRNVNSADFGKYIWFGLQLYDTRYDICPGFAEIDGGKDVNTGMFIYLPEMGKYNQKSVVIGQNNCIKYNAYNEILTAFSSVKAKGYLPNTAFEDLYIGGMNIGWELPGTFDVCAEIDRLSMYPVY